MADLYGPNRLVAAGLIPAAPGRAEPGMAAPAGGRRPARRRGARAGHFLHFIAFEIGRGPDGRWWVLSDRTDAPSGAGFALETRVAATQTLPDLHRRSPRPAPRRVLPRLPRRARPAARRPRRAARPPDARAPLTDTYYEQAYIARYLGLHAARGGRPRGRGRAAHGPHGAGAASRSTCSGGGWTGPGPTRWSCATARASARPASCRRSAPGSVTMVNALGAGAPRDAGADGLPARASAERADGRAAAPAPRRDLVVRRPRRPRPRPARGGADDGRRRRSASGCPTRPASPTPSRARCAATRRDARPRHRRLDRGGRRGPRRQGAGDALDHAGLGRRPAGARAR